MASGQKCTACSKTLLMMDTKLSAGSGFYHKECFRCTHCNGQLTTLNFAMLKGVLYCKPHYQQLFKLRGKYDDIPTGPGGSKAEEDSPDGGAATPGKEVKAAAAAAESSAQPVATAPAPAPATGGAAVAAAAVEAGVAPVTPEPSSAERADAPAPEAPTAAPATTAATSEERVKPAASASSSNATDAAASAAAQAAKGALAAVAALGSGSPAPAPAPAPAYPDRPVPQRVIQPASYTAPAGTPAAAPAAVKIVPASEAGPKPTGPKFGGGGLKCPVCSKTVFSAEPHVADGDKAWHKTCFKCANCKGNLSLTTWAQIDGVLLDKACYKKLFSARGKYDDVIASVKATAAADAAAAAEAPVATAVAVDAPEAPAPAAEAPTAAGTPAPVAAVEGAVDA